ncbi:MAG: hypothetical protein Q9159_007165, partial [Coniocarpon cinnabarinum]
MSQTNTDDTSLAGTLFKNINFFVLQRVPTRSIFCDAIRRHGGHIVTLDINADITIGDHTRISANPPHTISWKWIEDSIAATLLLDKEPYLAGPKETQVRQPGALKPSRSTRMPFSEEDDVFLYHFVKKRERLGARVLGNEIYAELERINPRHTLQSWRDRWKKYVGLTPPKRALEEEKMQENEEPNGEWAEEAGAPVSAALSSPKRQNGRGQDDSQPPEDGLSSGRLGSRPSARPHSVDHGETHELEQSIENLTDVDSVTAPKRHEMPSDQPSGAGNSITRNAALHANSMPATSAQEQVNGVSTSPTAGAQPPEVPLEIREMLLIEANTILKMDSHRRTKAWREFAKHVGWGTPEFWGEYFEDCVRPSLQVQNRISAASDLIWGFPNDREEEDDAEAQHTENESLQADITAPLPSSLNGEPQVKEEFDPNVQSHEAQSTPQKPSRPVPQAASQVVSPRLSKRLQRSQSPMVIVPAPSPRSSQKRVRFSNEPNNQDTPRRSKRLEKTASPSYVDIPSPGVKQKREEELRRNRERLEASQSEHNFEQSPEPVILVSHSRDGSGSQLGSGNQNRPVTRPTELEVQTKHSKAPEEATDQAHEASNIKQEQFKIWQGSNYVEDEKENSPKRKSPSRPHERPPQALDFTEQGMQFRLEPAMASVEDQVFTESDHDLQDQHAEASPRKRRRLNRVVLEDEEGSEENNETSARRDADNIRRSYEVDDEHFTPRHSQMHSNSTPFLDAREALSPVREIPREQEEQIFPPQDSGRARMTVEDYFSVEEFPNDDERLHGNGIRCSKRPSAEAARSSQDGLREGSADQISGQHTKINGYETQPSIEHSSLPHAQNQETEDDESSAGFQTDSAFEEDEQASRRVYGYRNTQDLIDDDDDDDGTQRVDLTTMPPSSPPRAQDSQLPLLPQESQQRTPTQSQQQIRLTPDATPTQTGQQRPQTSQRSNQDTNIRNLASQRQSSQPSQHSHTNDKAHHPRTSQSAYLRDEHQPIQSFIQYHISHSNLTQDTIIWALERTSFNSRLASEVLAHYSKRGTLLRKPGVWSQSDDAAILGSNGAKIREVKEFHGRVGARMALLEEVGGFG